MDLSLLTQNLGYPSLFLVSIVSQAIFPIPVELMALAMWKFHFESIFVITVIIIGLAVGAILDYLFGRYELQVIPWFKKEKRTKSFKRAEKFYRRYGKWSLLLTFIPFLGAYFPLLAGILEESFFDFLVLYVAGKVVYWAVIFEAIKYLKII